MNLLKRIWNAFKTDGVKGVYQAAVYTWGERSWLFQTLQDARYDIDTMTRCELQRKHRYFVQNDQVVQKIRNLRIQFSTSFSGLIIVPNSKDQEWNKRRARSWAQWAKQPDIGSRQCLRSLEISWEGSLFDDGEIFIIKTKDKDGNPKIQTIEAHRCQTPPDMQGNKEIVDGVHLDRFGMPLRYYIATGLDPNHFSPIPAAQIIHKFKYRRPGQVRGIPDGFCALNITHDVADMHKLEMQAAKMASQIGVVETNSTGEVSVQDARRTNLNINTQNVAGQAVNKQVGTFYNVILGSQRVALRAGDDLKQFQIDRPSVATQNYWDLCYTLICTAYNVPKMLVMPYSLQGTVTRADLEVSSNAFKSDFEIIKEILEELYEWQTNWAVQFDASLKTKPEDWQFCAIRPPRAPNVDVGYNASALATALANGTETYQDLFAAMGKDWREQFDESGEAAKYMFDLSKRLGIPVELIADKLKTGLVVDKVEETTISDSNNKDKPN